MLDEHSFLENGFMESSKSTNVHVTVQICEKSQGLWPNLFFWKITRGSTALNTATDIQKLPPSQLSL